MAKTIKEMTEVMLAYERGEEIECSECLVENWRPTSDPAWNWANFDYRIKPKPHYRPYANAEEVMEDIKKHGGWVRRNVKDSNICAIKDNSVDHPSHYNDYDVEVIEMMRRIWGDDAVKTFCKLNAFKYRMRAGHKDDLEQDLKKEQWYLDFIEQLENE